MDVPATGSVIDPARLLGAALTAVQNPTKAARVETKKRISGEDAVVCRCKANL
jgi:hypothetical protein